MLVTYFDQNCVKKYTRTDQSAFDWIEDGSIEIDTPIQLKCIHRDIYVVSRWQKDFREELQFSVYWLSEDLKEIHRIFKNQDETDINFGACDLIGFKDKLCIFSLDENEFWCLKDKDKFISEK